MGLSSVGGYGGSGIHSLIPIMKSNEQDGYKVSHKASGLVPSNFTFPTYYVFDGNFPPKGYNEKMSSNDEYTCIYSNGPLDIYIELPFEKKLLVVVPTYATPDGVWTFSQTIEASYSDDGSKYTKIPMFQHFGGGSLVIPETEVTPHKYYKIHIPNMNGYAICLSNLYLFGK